MMLQDSLYFRPIDVVNNIIFMRKGLYRNESLIRICNYGYNAYVVQNFLIVYGTIRLTQRPFQIRNLKEVQLINEEKCQLQIVEHDKLYFFINMFDQFKKQAFRTKKIVIKPMQIPKRAVLQTDSIFTSGWKSVWKCQNPYIIEEMIYEQVVGRLRLSLLKANIRIGLSCLIMDQYWAKQCPKSKQKMERYQQYLKKCSLFELKLKMTPRKCLIQLMSRGFSEEKAKQDIENWKI